MNGFRFSQIIFIVLVASSCQNRNYTSQTLNSYPVIHPLVSDTTYIKEYVADIHSRQNVEIHARVKGYLEEACVDEGNYVKAGQRLFCISSQRFKEELAKANAAVKSAIAAA